MCSHFEVNVTCSTVGSPAREFVTSAAVRLAGSMNVARLNGTVNKTFDAGMVED